MGETADKPFNVMYPGFANPHVNWVPEAVSVMGLDEANVNVELLTPLMVTEPPPTPHVPLEAAVRRPDELTVRFVQVYDPDDTPELANENAPVELLYVIGFEAANIW
jgi:hypothetical protein